MPERRGIRISGRWTHTLPHLDDRQNARIEHDKVLARAMTAALKDNTQLLKQFSDNESFKKWLSDSIFAVTYEEPAIEKPVRPTYRAPAERLNRVSNINDNRKSL